MLTPVINDYRRELKPKVLTVAAEMFREKGIRAVKMDDIAHHLTISKRTLYELYPNKEQLVYECIKEVMESHERSFRAIIPENASSMDILILFFKERINNMVGVNPLLYDELMNYPRMKQLFEEHRAKHSNDTVVFFRRGVEEGFFMSNIDIEVLHRINTILGDQIRIQRLHHDFPIDRLFKVLINMFIRAFCTIKGIEVLDAALGETQQNK